MEAGNMEFTEGIKSMNLTKWKTELAWALGDPHNSREVGELN